MDARNALIRRTALHEWILEQTSSTLNELAPRPERGKPVQ